MGERQKVEGGCQPPGPDADRSVGIGNGERSLQEGSCLYPVSFVLGRANVSRSKPKVRCGNYVRRDLCGVLSNERPYCDAR